MKKKIIILLLTLGVFGLIGSIQASTHGWFKRSKDIDPEKMAGHYKKIFQHKAEFLGVSQDQLEEYWAQGLSWEEILEELGISKEELKEKMQQAHQEKKSQFNHKKGWGSKHGFWK